MTTDELKDEWLKKIDKLIRLRKKAWSRVIAMQTRASNDERFLEDGGRARPRYRAAHRARDRWQRLNDVLRAETLLAAWDWDTLANYMDDALRDDLHIQLAPCEPVVFLAAYLRRHRDHFGEDFSFN